MDPVRRQTYLLYFTMFQILLGFGAVIPILPHYAKDLGANSFQMGLLVTLWAGAQFLFSPIWGSLSDRIGRRSVLMAGLAGYALTLAILAVAPNIWVALFGRFVGGMLSAATIPAAQAYIADITTGQDRTRGMAGISAAMNLGFLVGPALGGLLAGLGYRGTFGVATGLAVINVILTFFMLPEPDRRQAATTVRKSFSGLKAVRIALAGPESLHFLLAFAGTFGGSSLFSMLGFYLLDRMDAGAELLAVAFTAQAVATFGYQTLLLGRVTAWLGEERSVRVALLMGAAGFAALIFAPSFVYVVAGLMVLAYGFAFIRPLVTAMISRRTTMEQGMAMGIQTSFDALGRTLGPLWAGSIYLWRDWAPFASAIVMYLLFYFWTRAAWGDGGDKPNRQTAVGAAGPLDMD